jgi:hypothetical protein
MASEEKKRMLKHPDRADAIQTVKNGTGKTLKPNRFNYAVHSQLKIDEASSKW